MAESARWNNSATTSGGLVVCEREKGVDGGSDGFEDASGVGAPYYF